MDKLLDFFYPDQGTPLCPPVSFSYGGSALRLRKKKAQRQQQQQRNTKVNMEKFHPKVN